MKRKGIIFAHLEQFKKCKYPVFIKNILIETAFDTAASLRAIKKCTIEVIENFVNDRTDLLKGTSDNSGNLKNIPFKFLIGHEALILRLPNDVEEYLLSKNERKKEFPAIDELKKLFITRIKNFTENKHIELTLNPEDLSKFTNNKSCVKCVANCPICSSKIDCTYSTSWKISDYCKHIVTCAQNLAQNNARPTQIQRSTPNVVIQEVRNALA